MDALAWGRKAAKILGLSRPEGGAESRRRPHIEAVRIPRAEHPISRKNVSKAALRVLYGLHEAGYQALLVGGGVRDQLLGLSPKDFDIATDAHPEDVKRVFRR